MFEVVFENEGTYEAEQGETILAASLKNGIPHMHVCGGNARCSTCRVLVVEGMENLSPPEDLELALTRKKDFDAKMRLACQTRVQGPVRVRRLVLDETDADIVVANSGPAGREERLVVLFSDLRDFTGFAERQLPYDLIHILNRYFRAMGQAVIDNGGRIDKYIGDGMMALFGLNGEDDSERCRNAARAAIEMKRVLEDVNEYVSRHFGETLRMGIGLHIGRVVFGEVGHPRHREYTALGDGVNTAARIEAATRKAGATILVSQEFADGVGEAAVWGRSFLAKLKGKDGNFRLFELAGCNCDAGDSAGAIRRHLREKMPLTLAPAMLRLAFHEAMTRNAMSASLSDEEARKQIFSTDEHEGLQPALAFVEDTLAALSGADMPVPRASDLIYLAGAVAVEITDGPFIPLSIPVRKRRVVDPRSQIPGIPRETEVFSAMMIRFRRAGLDRKHLVALMGAHTLGKAHGRFFTEDPYRFDNEFFKRLQREDLSLRLAMLQSDRELLHDERARELVELYARDQDVFFRDFVESYTAMIEA